MASGPLQREQAEAALEGGRRHVILFENVGEGPEAVTMNEPRGPIMVLTMTAAV